MSLKYSLKFLDSNIIRYPIPFPTFDNLNHNKKISHTGDTEFLDMCGY